MPEELLEETAELEPGTVDEIVPEIPKVIQEMPKMTLWDSFKSLFTHSSGQPAQPPVQSGAFFVTKEGLPTRFFLWASNNFKDKHGEIITEAAHKEFVEWCDENNVYPELWLWHAAGSKSGDVDWMDYADGFLVVSGLINQEHELRVKSLIDQDVRVSHGFLGRWKDTNICTQYRSWEVSILPGWAAANAWTSYASIKEEAEMAFSDKKRAWLMEVGGVSETKVKEWEDATAEAKAHLEALGIQYKGDDEAEPDNQDEIATKEILTSLLSQQAHHTEILAAIAKEVVTLKQDDDSKISALIQAEVTKLGTGFSPASSKETITETSEASAEEKEQKNAWFKNLASV